MPETNRRAVLSVLLLLAFAAASPAASAAEKQPDVDLQWGVRIPLRDGVELAATVYRPKGQKDPLPVVFTLTPYIGDSYHPRGMYFARHGYVYVLVDVRGRGSSGGSFDPFAQESRDGYDVVEWLARQSWSNGKVAMWGGSYAGYDQWATAKARPPHLATIVPAAAVHPGIDYPAPKNIFLSYDVQWLTFTSGKTGNGLLFGESSYWTSKFLAMYRDHRPFRELDQIVGNPSSAFQQWIAHPSYDDFWKAMVPTREQYAGLNLPILTITGHYDGDQVGALTYYRAHMREASQEERNRHYLIIGPWDHPGTRTPVREVGGLTFGTASVLDLNDLHRQWYDWTMKSGAKPDFLKKRVAYYVVGPGAEEWKYADSLEEIGAQKRTFYLGSETSQHQDAYHSGDLADAKPAKATPPDAWVYDPLDIRPGEESASDDTDGGLTDQRPALDLHGNGAIYHSAPFSEATEVSGQVKLSLWISLDVPDTDLEVGLYEILPDGKSIFLTSDTLRARYRDSLEKETLVPRGEIVQYRFEGFPWFSARSPKAAACASWSTVPTPFSSKRTTTPAAWWPARRRRTHARPTSPSITTRAPERVGDPDREVIAA